MSVLALENVSLRYAPGEGGAQAPLVLDRISLEIAGDDFVVVIGRSGSGKTSLLNLAAGFLTPSSGRISLDGRSLSGPGSDRAVVFQDDALYPWLSAIENVAFPLRLRGVGKDQRLKEAQSLLECVGLPDAAERKVWELSGGMRQRVGIARALASQPRFLLMDEPLGALDALTRVRMQSFLLDMWQASRAGALLITHSIDEALMLATRIVVLTANPGRIAKIIPVNFGRGYLSGIPQSDLRASAEFKRLHDDLTGLIHSETGLIHSEDEGVAA